MYVNSIANRAVYGRVKPPTLMDDDNRVTHSAVKVVQPTVPVYEKYALTLTEAAKYFGIGEKKLKRLAEENQSCDDGFILMNGCKVLFKRERFSQFLDRTGSI